jgi:hypothetical protein
MNERVPFVPFFRPVGMCALVLALAGVPSVRAGASPGLAESKTEAGSDQVPAKCVTDTGSILRREAPGKEWHLVGKGEDLPAGNLLLGLPGAVIESADAAVRLTMDSDLSGTSPYPVVENAVILRDKADRDLDFTLDRGRVTITNQKKEGAAHVRVQVLEHTGDLTLEEPGSQVTLELFGRWARGVPFTTKPGPKHVPTVSLIALVTRGEVSIATSGQQHLLKAPPGPALIEWDNVTGSDTTPQRLEKLPAWAEPSARATDVARQRKAALERLHKRALETRDIPGVLHEFVKSDDPADRRLAVFGMGAIDDLRGLGQALQDTKNPDVWDNGVRALRHWIGRGPGQDQLLYRGLIERANYSPGEAEAVLQLLHSYGDADLARPETYEMLIDFLDHNKFAVRGLAYWHLSRLVPAGKEFGYNPSDSKESREDAIKKWRRLIPPGKMPPAPKKAEEK